MHARCTPQNLFHHIFLHPCTPATFDIRNFPRSEKVFALSEYSHYIVDGCHLIIRLPHALRRARNVKSRLDSHPDPHCTLSSTRSHPQSKIDLLQFGLGALIDRVEAVRPLLVTNPLYLASTFHALDIFGDIQTTGLVTMSSFILFHFQPYLFPSFMCFMLRR